MQACCLPKVRGQERGLGGKDCRVDLSSKKVMARLQGSPRAEESPAQQGEIKASVGTWERCGDPKGTTAGGCQPATPSQQEEGAERGGVSELVLSLWLRRCAGFDFRART